MNNFQLKQKIKSNPAYRIELKNQIISKLKEQQATSLSNKELRRCLSNCIAAKKLIFYAKGFRDSGILMIKDITL